MSYAGNVSGARGRRVTPGAAPERAPLSTLPGGARRQPAAAEEPEIAWREMAIFAAGLALGAALGAGSALLVAPETGEETRAALARRGRRAGRRAHDAWDDLRDELRFAARRGRRRMRRAIASRGLDLRDRDDDCD